jgi:hypothetical protein
MVTSRPTVSITRWWAGVDSVREQKKKSQKNACKSRRLQLVRAIVGKQMFAVRAWLSNDSPSTSFNVICSLDLSLYIA